MDENIIKVLDYIMDAFDFEKVRKVMVALGWKWAGAKGDANGVPTLDEIKQGAANLLWDLANDPKNKVIATGGFRAEKDFSDPDDPWMRLVFEVTDWDACPSEMDS